MDIGWLVIEPFMDSCFINFLLMKQSDLSFFQKIKVQKNWDIFKFTAN